MTNDRAHVSSSTRAPRPSLDPIEALHRGGSIIKLSPEPLCPITLISLSAVVGSPQIRLSPLSSVMRTR